MYTNNAYLNDSHIDRKDKSNPLVVTMCGTYKLYTKQKLPTWRPRGRVDFQLLYVASGKAHFYFDKDGTVVESSTRVLAGIPMISGLKFSSIVLGSKLDVGNSEIFGRILELTQAFDKYDITSDKIYFDSQGNVTLTIGSVRVMLGSCDNLTDTLFELKQIMPKLAGRKGTLHMEDFTEDKKSIIFEKD